MFQMTPDGDFILDICPEKPNLVVAAGFSGHGFKMAPEVGDVLADLATGEKPNYNMETFAFARFEKWKMTKISLGT